MKIKKEYLLLIASIVWLFAGYNILHIGLELYQDYTTIINVLLSILVFAIFWFMIFSKLTKKHTIRIKNYLEEKQFILKFFDKKSFMIMAFMIVFGLSIRNFHLMPDVCIAVFYTGLGSALFLAGVVFCFNYFQDRYYTK